MPIISLAHLKKNVFFLPLFIFMLPLGLEILCVNSMFNNIQVIWLLSVLLLEETEENHADLQ